MAHSGCCTILIALDTSEHSLHAFNWYVDTMHRSENEVVLLFCGELPHYYGTETPEAMRSAIEKMEDTSKRVQQQFSELLKSKNINGRVKSLVGGKPGEAIIQTAKQENAILIVIGSRGMGTIRRTIMGSVSDFVLHHAHIPVIVCKQ